MALPPNARTTQPRTQANTRTSVETSPSPTGKRYPGPERRRHRVYVTRNTEYHLRDGFCIAVRDRRTGDFLDGHLALRRRVQGGIRFYGNGAISPNAGEPTPGEALYFTTEGRDLVTSSIERIERPAKEIISSYPRHARRESA